MVELKATAPGKQPTNLINVGRFILRNPQRSGVLLRKAVNRVLSRTRNAPSRENTDWVNAHSEDSGQIGRRIAPDLWDEAERYASLAQERGQEILKNVPVDLGGGGDDRFLYWLTRLLTPNVVVEAGVAAGWTSRAVLTAMRKNGKGVLYSSDFPYFRIDHPEYYVGYLIEPELRSEWKLYLDGDTKSLPKILREVSAVDLFHYDSDKSWSGRDSAVRMIRAKLSEGGLILMDDILENGWFRHYVKRENVPFTIINGRVGVIGELKKPA